MKFSVSYVAGHYEPFLLILICLSMIIPMVHFVPTAQALFGTSFDKYVGNPLATIPTYGASGVVHPDVVYFSGGMDGYKYWMVYTPYPPQPMENPSVVRSNDGITWTDVGITNPVIPEGAPGAWNGLENPDPDFTYVSAYNKWFLIWDGGDQATDSRKLALAYSSDGKTWTQYDGAPVNGNPNPIILAGDDTQGQSWERAGSISKTSCPTLLYENGIFTLYYVEEASGNNNGQVGFATFTWNDATHSVENLKRYSGNPTISVGCGHIDLSKKDNVYYLYAVKGSSLILFTSVDKISWTNQGTVLEGGAWDSSIYRSSVTTDSSNQMAIFDGKMKLFYSAFGNPGIGLATTQGPPAWFDLSWTRRKAITITNSNPTSLAGYQVQLNVAYDSDMKADFSDLRFIDADGVTSIPYWTESYTSSVSAAVWVRIPYVPSTGSTAIYMYYGNPSAASLSDGRSMFDLFDDFEHGYGTGWTIKATMPAPPKADGSAAVYNGKLYVFGGYDQTAGDPRAETYMYDPSMDTWTQKASMPTARWGPIAVEFNGLIYVFGGTVNVDEVYNPVTDSWSTRASLPSGFNQGLMAVRYGDKIHLFYHELHYEYDPATDTYSAKTPMPTPRRWSTVAVVGSKIYVIGGYHNSYGAMDVNEAYDPATDTWTTKTPMPISRYGITRENPVINGKIYVTHGLDGGFHTDNYVYDPSTDTWEQKSSANYPRDGTECGVINNKLYVVGGRADYVGPYGVYYNEEYDPSSDNPLLWSFSNADKVKRDTSAKYEGNYGLMIYDDTSQGQYAEHPQSLPSLEMDFYWDLTDDLGQGVMQPQGRISFVDPSLSNYGSLYYYRDSDGIAKFVWYSGSYTILTSGAWNTWYHVRIDWNGADSKVAINGVEYAVTATSATSDRIRLESVANVMSKMYFDMVRVRKYTSSEPTVTIGPEETVPPPPTADFTWSPSEPKAGEIVTFNASASTPGAGTIVSYEWNFGDENTGTGGVAVHTYSTQGTYTVSLKVTNSQGQSGTKEEQVQVAPPRPLPPPPSWFNLSWPKTKPIGIINTSPDDLTGYQVKINVTYDPSMKSDFSDLRFTDSDGSTLLKYWIQSYNSSASATVWVRVPTIPGSGTTTVYMYFGNPSAITTSNGDTTFEFFDDFAGNTLNTTKWTQNVVNTITQSVNGNFRFLDATKSEGTYWIYGDSRGRVGSQDQANWAPLTQFVIEFKTSMSDSATSEMGEGFVGLVSNTNTIIGVAGYQDWMGASYDSQRGVITENQASSLGSGVAKRIDSSYDSFKAVGTADETTWKIINDGTMLQFYDGNGFFAGAPISSTVSKVALAAGAYGGYPYLDYIQLDYIMVHKYASSEPAVSFGQAQTPTITIQTCNSTGVLKEMFDQGETVYVFGNGYPPSATFDIFVVNDVLTWTDGMTIPPRVAGTTATVSSNSLGIIPPTAVWTQATSGKYDIVVDVNGNGKYDQGFDALDDNNVQSTAGFLVTSKPTLNFNPVSVTCRKFNETFTVQLNLSAADNVDGFKFEICYNSTLLDVSNVIWTAWGTGTYTADEVNGILTGSSLGNAITGDSTIVTVTFNATYYHIWKDETKVPGWKNNQSGTIYIQWANLSYAGSPDLSYVKGGIQNQINAGPDVTYTFSPIRGDIDNNGTVGVFDLRTVAAYYNQHNSTYDLNGDGIIDIFDLVSLASNFGFEYR